jgi:hypothetical protein
VKSYRAANWILSSRDIGQLEKLVGIESSLRLTFPAPRAERVMVSACSSYIPRDADASSTTEVPRMPTSSIQIHLRVV